jgi:hypothetical protein
MVADEADWSLALGVSGFAGPVVTVEELESKQRASLEGAEAALAELKAGLDAMTSSLECSKLHRGQRSAVLRPKRRRARSS